MYHAQYVKDLERRIHDLKRVANLVSATEQDKKSMLGKSLNNIVSDLEFLHVCMKLKHSVKGCEDGFTGGNPCPHMPYDSEKHECKNELCWE